MKAGPRLFLGLVSIGLLTKICAAEEIGTPDEPALGRLWVIGSPTAGASESARSLQPRTFRPSARLAADPAPSLDEPIILETTGSPDLITRILTFPRDGRTSRLDFEIGFSTMEPTSEGQFADSFTLSVSGGQSPPYSVLLTFDAFGVARLPNSPGAFTLPAESLQLTATDSRVPVLPGAISSYSFLGKLDLPLEFTAEELTVTLDLVDNGNTRMSRGYTIIQSQIPEPSVVGLLVMPVVWMLRRARKPACPGPGQESMT